MLTTAAPGASSTAGTAGGKLFEDASRGGQNGDLALEQPEIDRLREHI